MTSRHLLVISVIICAGVLFASCSRETSGVNVVRWNVGSPGGERVTVVCDLDLRKILDEEGVVVESGTQLSLTGGFIIRKTAGKFQIASDDEIAKHADADAKEDGRQRLHSIHFQTIGSAEDGPNVVVLEDVPNGGSIFMRLCIDGERAFCSAWKKVSPSEVQERNNPTLAIDFRGSKD